MLRGLVGSAVTSRLDGLSGLTVDTFDCTVNAVVAGDGRTAAGWPIAPGITSISNRLSLTKTDGTAPSCPGGDCQIRVSTTTSPSTTLTPLAAIWRARSSRPAKGSSLTLRAFGAMSPYT